MENSMVEIKNDLVEWIENLDNLETIQSLLDLKNSYELSSLVYEVKSESLKVDFDEQFAAGMTSDELLENISAHIETMASEECSSLVSDIQSE